MTAAPELPSAYRLVALDKVGSTNDEAKRLAGEGAEDGTLVWAREQTAGRGRHGRTWVSPPGNLYLSLVLRPDCAPAEALGLGFAAAVALGTALGSVVPPMTELRYKWPNDVLLNGAKVAGILMESAPTSDGMLDWLVLGLGVNVDHYPDDTETKATSLAVEGGKVPVEEVLELFCRQFLTWADRWLNGGFAPVRKAWLLHASGLGERIEVRLNGETLEGVFEDLDEHGALILKLDDGTKRVVNYGEIFPSAG